MPRNKNVIEIEFDPEIFWASQKCNSFEDRWFKKLCENLRRKLKEERKMLNETEEQSLRKIVKDNSPMRPVNQIIDRQMTVGQYIGGLLKSLRPMPVVAGASDAAPVDNRPIRTTVGEDTELLVKTEHVRKKGEKLMQFFARTGLGAAQIRPMSKGEITRFVETVSQHEPVQAPRELTEGPRPRPQRFVLDMF